MANAGPERSVIDRPAAGEIEMSGRTDRVWRDATTPSGRDSSRMLTDLAAQELLDGVLRLAIGRKDPHSPPARNVLVAEHAGPDHEQCRDIKPNDLSEFQRRQVQGKPVSEQQGGSEQHQAHT